MTQQPTSIDLHHWFLHYADELLGFFRRKLGEPDAPDMVQEVYLRVLSRPTAAEIREPRAFLFRIAANLAVDHVRKQSYRQFETDEGMEEWAASPAPGPEQEANDDQRAKSLCLALAELPPPCRHAFLLNRFDGLSHGEIAARMGVSVKTVQRYIAKAFEHCMDRLDNPS
ncbi:MAG: sigma-70 family RNA polymerase sigma factor [Methylococcaceae bacterium]|nr:sigma-70 family RNA polymerase sigma factor [Methylococcaceae bacterium]